MSLPPSTCTARALQAIPLILNRSVAQRGRDGGAQQSTSNVSDVVTGVDGAVAARVPRGAADASAQPAGGQRSLRRVAHHAATGGPLPSYRRVRAASTVPHSPASNAGRSPSSSERGQCSWSRGPRGSALRGCSSERMRGSHCSIDSRAEQSSVSRELRRRSCTIQSRAATNAQGCCAGVCRWARVALPHTRLPLHPRAPIFRGT